MCIIILSTNLNVKVKKAKRSDCKLMKSERTLHFLFVIRLLAVGSGRLLTYHLVCDLIILLYLKKNKINLIVK